MAKYFIALIKMTRVFVYKHFHAKNFIIERFSDN